MKVRLRTALVEGRLYDSDSAHFSDSSEEEQVSALTSLVKNTVITASPTVDNDRHEEASNTPVISWACKILIMLHMSTKEV